MENEGMKSIKDRNISKVTNQVWENKGDIVDLKNKPSTPSTAATTSVDTTNFDGVLSPTDDTVQKALETLDDASGGGGGLQIQEVMIVDSASIDNYVANSGGAGVFIMEYNFNTNILKTGSLTGITSATLRSRRPFWIFGESRTLDYVRLNLTTLNNTQITHFGIIKVTSFDAMLSINTLDIIFEGPIITPSNGFIDLSIVPTSFSKDDYVYVFIGASVLNDRGPITLIMNLL